MIKVTVFKNKKNVYVGFSSIGHAGYAREGEDIVCAAVSALVINTINSIDALTEDEVSVEADEAEGLLTCMFHQELSDKSLVLMDALVLGLGGIQEEYQNEYIRVILKEV